MNFKDFKKDVESAFNAMIADNLFVVNVDKDLLWMSYLLSFEDETIRQDHNCNACKSFIRHYGKVVAIDPQTYKVKTFWDDVHTPGYEKTASDLLGSKPHNIPTINVLLFVNDPIVKPIWTALPKLNAVRYHHKATPMWRARHAQRMLDAYAGGALHQMGFVRNHLALLTRPSANAAGVRTRGKILV